MASLASLAVAALGAFGAASCHMEMDDDRYVEPPPPYDPCEGRPCYPPYPYDSGALDTGADLGADAKNPAACPATEPVVGAACSTSLLVCAYENLCPLIALETNWYRCVGGKWSFENTLESPIDCPKAAPRDGQACGCAMYLPSKCSYTTACGLADAVCDGATQKWTVTSPTCSDAGASDAPASDAAPTETSSADAATETASADAADETTPPSDASAD